MKCLWPGLRATLALLVPVFISACHPNTRTQGIRDADSTMTPLHASAGVGGGMVHIDLASSEIVLPEYLPVRRYQDVFTENDINRKVWVEYGWDYRRGVVVETVYDETGHEFRKTDKPGYTLNFADRELELAIALAREEPSLHELLSASDLNFYAGFVLRNENDAGCKAGSRCVHVIVSRGDGQQHVAHAIVDLMTRRVVHAALDPDRKPDPVADKNRG